MKSLFIFTICLSVLMRSDGSAQVVKPSQTPARSAPVAPTRNHRQAEKQILTPPNGKNEHDPDFKPGRQNTISFADARRRYIHERHDRMWWRRHYTTIVFVTGGYYYWDAGYWFPAWGYDPVYDNYDYDGPIYTYGNLLPDQVIINVQRALAQLGYYSGGLTGSLGGSTRAAIAAYQQDTGLVVSGAIDAATVEALGLY